MEGGRGLDTKVPEMEALAEVSYPIAEIFTSPQGEGLWAGTSMCFIRFAGCNVGKPYTKDAKETLGLQVYQERCTSWTHNSFPCDTNYRSHSKSTVADLRRAVVRSGVKHVCLTGGEPFMHDLRQLIKELWYEDVLVHIETSGTKPTQREADNEEVWVTVSPKLGYLPWVLSRDNVDEIKLLVDDTFDEAIFVRDFLPLTEGDAIPVWLSPVNDEYELKRDNMARCLELQRKYPGVRVMLQQHKIWKVR